MVTQELTYLLEPLLVFGHEQKHEYPKDGLTLFGPLVDSAKPEAIRIGVIGTIEGIKRFKTWAKSIQSYIPSLNPNKPHHSSFPGFEAVFKTKWPDAPMAELAISVQEISNAVRLSHRHEAIFNTVSLYTEKIAEYARTVDAQPDFWFVIVPEEVFRYGRPLSIVPSSERIPAKRLVRKPKEIEKIIREGSLLPGVMEEIKLYQHELNFHNQLKARLLKEKAVVQIVRETTLTPLEFLNKVGKPLRGVQDPATVAWNLCTTAFFKAGGKPWALADIRPGVCYVGLVYKKDPTHSEAGNACCGAQMFLRSGEGLVFKGAIGNWYSERTRDFHLDKPTAAMLMRLIISEYEKIHKQPPDELFIHGQTSFNDEEWEGFMSSVPSSTNLVGIRIRKEREIKLYTPGMQALLRGTAMLLTPKLGYLWTNGFAPRLNTYPGWEVPNPLRVEINRGKSELQQVLTDILSLTKINFNACVYGDGEPVTLKFANAIGEILTAAPLEDIPPLPFRHYI